MAQRKMPAPDPARAVPQDAPVPEVPTAVWVDGKVCVEIIDTAPSHELPGVCRCPACHGAMYADLAAKFYPNR